MVRVAYAYNACLDIRWISPDLVVDSMVIGGGGMEKMVGGAKQTEYIRGFYRGPCVSLRADSGNDFLQGIRCVVDVDRPLET